MCIRDRYITCVDDLKKMVDAGLKKVALRALLTCRSKYGVCQKCYGWDLSTRRPVAIGTAVGIIAAQSIGEPGTQMCIRDSDLPGPAVDRGPSHQQGDGRDPVSYTHLNIGLKSP